MDYKREWTVIRLEMELDRSRRRAALYIQRLYRGGKARRLMRQLRLHHRSIIPFQSIVRGFLARVNLSRAIVSRLC